MAGSNRFPAPNRGQVPPNWGTPDAEPPVRPHGAAPHGQPHLQDDPMLRWAQQGGAPQQHAPYPAPNHPQSAAPQGYDPYAGYARPDVYAQQPMQPQAVDYTQERTHPGGHGRGAPQTGYDAHGYPLQPHATPASAYGQSPAHDDQQNWDLSHYSAHGGASGQLHGGHQHPQSYADPRNGQPHYEPAPYQGQQAGYSQAGYDQHGQLQPGYVQAGYDAAGGQYPAGQGYGPHDGQAYDQDGAYDTEPEIDEPEPARRGPSPVVVIAALVGAIAVGGGLAYGYRMLGGGKTGGKPPVVKADTSPAKTKPADAGGKDVAHTDKKFINRYGEQGPTAAQAPAAAAPVVAAAPAEAEAPRKVTTLIVNKDGTITPQSVQQAAPTPPPGPAPGATVPGMVIEGLTPRAPPRAAAEPPVTPVAKAPPVADLPLPRTKVAAAPVEPKAEAPVAKKKPVQRDDLAAPKASVAVAPAQGGGTVVGFVPVLASKKTRDEALKSFADLFQKYPDVLASKAPDVIEANLQDKGVWFRTVVGPPGSREAAREICSKLDAQGFKGCWVTAYRQ